ncbi:MAG: septal ring lytic transglycosylase RlpA family protein [Pseudomonadota bacterium]|uniref:septal ring lytic transglycosylase RlpA family protein n=1 Tax=Alcanivorax sp. TaxID=1872427 RepID=UPI0024405D4D|nr:septal ring lytic transglycosylase RlpA family protein [Alcanivorax sp.]MEE3319724.1 septal ring lytic transglycosylase RlpA family protein [Pseudomonadota bacterium]
MKRLATLVTASAFLGACVSTPPPSTPEKDPAGAPGSDRYSLQQDTAPHEHRDVSGLPEPEPKQEPRSKYGNMKSYSVWGKTYHVLPDATGYVAEGNASWYGQKFHGHRTSSGESFDMYQFTAAHRSLPLPTYVRVTNLDNGKNLIVRVNDRGPFHENRIIDLSWAAAVRLGIEQAGTGRVRVEALSPDTDNQSNTVPTAVRAAVDSPPPRSASTAQGQRLYLQAGAFQDRSSAERLRQSLRDQLGLESEIRQQQSLFRVWIGPYQDDSSRQQMRQQVANAGFDRPMPVTP